MSLEEIRGVGPETAKKLIAGGIKTVEQLSVVRPDEVKALIGVSMKSAKDIILHALDMGMSEVKIYDGDEYEEWWDNTVRYIPTGSNTLDEYFGGGWISMSSNGLYGLQASGKSQMIYTAIASCMDLGLHVLLEETEANTIHIPRIKEVANARGYTYDGKLLRFYPAQNVGSVFGQFRGYLYLDKLATREELDVGLIAVDSFNAKFRRTYSGREQWPDRSTEFGRHIDYLEEMAKKYNAVTLLTFQCGVTPDATSGLKDKMKYHGNFYPVGGTLVQHNINTWLSLQQSSGGEKSTKSYHASITDHSFLPMENFDFVINEQGVRDL